MPNNCVFLVDTYDTLEGVKQAIEAGKQLRARGHEMVGIRLDSGDLAYLSIEARKLLDGSGFEKTVIVAIKDWHPGNNVGDVIDLGGSKQVLWPDHCVQQTRGAEFVDGLNQKLINKVFYKGTDPNIDSYSGFFDNNHRKSTGLGDFLKQQRVDEVYILGLATDYCVKYTVLDSVELGFTTHVILEGCRGIDVNPGDCKKAINEMKRADAIMI